MVLQRRVASKFPIFIGFDLWSCHLEKVSARLLCKPYWHACTADSYQLNFQLYIPLSIDIEHAVAVIGWGVGLTQKKTGAWGSYHVHFRVTYELSYDEIWLHAVSYKLSDDTKDPILSNNELSIGSPPVWVQRIIRPAPWFVICVYRCGSERTGLFIAMMNMLDALTERNEVDVFNSVKRVRQARPEFIPTLVRLTRGRSSSLATAAELYVD